MKTIYLKTGQYFVKLESSIPKASESRWIITWATILILAIVVMASFDK